MSWTVCPNSYRENMTISHSHMQESIHTNICPLHNYSLTRVLVLTLWTWYMCTISQLKDIERDKYCSVVQTESFILTTKGGSRIWMRRGHVHNILWPCPLNCYVGWVDMWNRLIHVATRQKSRITIILPTESDDSLILICLYNTIKLIY